MKDARLARLHKRLDWLRRIEVSTEPPPGRAPFVKGEIAVEDLRAGRLLEGVEAVRAIARNVPAYLTFVPLLAIPAVARIAEADARGVAGKQCAIE